MAQITCKKCGKTFEATVSDVKKLHCLHCGARIKTKSAAKQQKKKKKYLWLYLIAGILYAVAAVLIITAKPWKKDIIAVAAGSFHTVGLKSDGTVVAVGDNVDGLCDVEDWTDIVDIASGGYHTVGLKSDGTVVAVGYNGDGQCDVDAWNN